MNQTQEEKLKRFVSDSVLLEAVKEVLMECYLRPRKDADVQVLAASRIAIDMLREAWKELLSYKQREVVTQERAGQLGM